MKGNLIGRVLMLSLASVFILTVDLKAETFDLSYTLTEGGYRLELDPANPYKGVKLEVNSDVATRYQITQRVLKPLESRDDPNSVIRDNFMIRGLRGTNRYGTFYVSTEDSAVRSDAILYTSNATGDADSFTLVYGIVRMEEIKPGDYFGRVSFTLSPIDSTRSPITRILDVYVKIEEREIKPSIEITTPFGSKIITLNSNKKEAEVFDVLVNINSKLNRVFTIKQLINTALESKEGTQLKYETINFKTQEVKKGMGISLTPLSSQPQTIYTSGPGGGADDQFIITYSLGDLSSQKAGKYISRIQYYLEEPGRQTTPLGILGLEIEIERIFDLLIAPQDQKGILEFRELKPRQEPKKNEVIIEIKTNAGKPYQVTQNIYSDLIDKEGTVIPSKYFNLNTESLDTKGTLKFPGKEEAKKGDTILFVSDDKGSPDKFKVIYELTIPEEIKAGNYSTRITYSLSEI